DLVKGRIRYMDLTGSSQRELEPIVRQIVKSREPDFVNFFNRAGAINIRSHTLEHIPGIGKKHLQDILDAREKKPFESFHDISARVAHLGNPEDLIVQRIVEELKGEAKYYLFAKAPAAPEEERHGGYGGGYGGGRPPFRDRFPPRR
ncbi:MAG TPA: DUF655 domain-containing protein, partial [Candidatus Norongarragalinales archaeon]|nr:DUF655 domain-containing protein [Candidatus Norongarragalinales archaeon]